MDRSVFSPALITLWPEDENATLIEDYRQLDIPIYCCGMSKKESVFKGRSAVEKILREFKPDIVQGVGIPPYRMALGYKSAIPFVTLRNYCSEDYPDQYGKLIGPPLAFVDMQLICKQMRRGLPFVTCSESLTKMYRQHQNLEIPFIRNGVDVSKYRKRDLSAVSSIRRKLDLPEDKTIFVYTGRLIDRKNQREAAEAFMKMKRRSDAVLLLLGDGTDMAGLQRDFGSHDNILLRGAVNNVEEYLHASDIYLATSKSEGLPNGVLEAMACGLPVLLSDIPQHMEVISAGSGFGDSYHLGSVDELSEKMDAVMEKDLASMGDISHRTVTENFTAEIMSSKYQDLYRKLVSKASVQ